MNPFFFLVAIVVSRKFCRDDASWNLRRFGTTFPSSSLCSNIGCFFFWAAACGKNVLTHYRLETQPQARSRIRQQQIRNLSAHGEISVHISRSGSCGRELYLGQNYPLLKLALPEKHGERKRRACVPGAGAELGCEGRKLLVLAFACLFVST